MSQAATKAYGVAMRPSAGVQPAERPAAAQLVGDHLDGELGVLLRRVADHDDLGEAAAQQTPGCAANTVSPPTRRNALSRPPMRLLRPPARMTPATRVLSQRLGCSVMS